jgi:hypothetical protein
MAEKPLSPSPDPAELRFSNKHDLQRDPKGAANRHTLLLFAKNCSGFLVWPF